MWKTARFILYERSPHLLCHPQGPRYQRRWVEGERRWLEERCLASLLLWQPTLEPSDVPNIWPDKLCVYTCVCVCVCVHINYTQHTFLCSHGDVNHFNSVRSEGIVESNTISYSTKVNKVTTTQAEKILVCIVGKQAQKLPKPVCRQPRMCMIHCWAQV